MTERRANRLRAVRAAVNLLEQHRVTSPPVDIDAIARALGLPVLTKQLPRNIFGATVYDGVRTRILVSASCFSSGHRRFTLAHELGHCCIDGHAEELFALGNELHYSEGLVGTRRDPLEVEADTFAAELLMPGAPTKMVAAELRPGLGMIRAVARYADVSLSSAAIRACELIDDPFAVVLTLNGIVQWAVLSGGMRDHGWARRSFKEVSAPPDSATVRLTKHRARVAERELESDTVLLSDWFPGAPCVWADEEALGLGDYGMVLSVITPQCLPSGDLVEHQRRQAEHAPRDWRAALRSYEWDDPDAPDNGG